MKFRKRALFASVSVFLLLAFTCNITVPAVLAQPGDSGTTPSVKLKTYPNAPNDDLDTAILAQMKQDSIVGISAAFVKDGKVVWSNGYGWADLEREEPAGPDTVYRIASISKTVVATALLQLWEQGEFNLDDDIGDYLGFPVRNPGYPDEKITFKMLLTHTSSILDDGGYLAALEAGNPPLLKDLLAPGGKANSENTWGAYKPGTRFNYSNFNSGIAACLVEKISGERFDRYCSNYIFKPLGMNAGFQPSDLAGGSQFAVLYRPAGDGGSFVPAFKEADPGEAAAREGYKLPPGNNYIGPAGGVRTSAADLAKFMVAHMNGGTREGSQILEKETVDLMHQMHWFGEGLDGFYRQKGLGFHITDSLAGRRLTGHAGQAYGLVSDLYFDRDENTGVVFITNGGNYKMSDSGYTNIEEAVINQIFSQLAGQPKAEKRSVQVINNNEIKVNGRTIVLPVPAENRAGEQFIPAISVADALETRIHNDEDSKTLILSGGGHVIRAKEGESSLTVDGVRVPLQTGNFEKNGHLMLPLKMLAGLMGANVQVKRISPAFFLE